MPWQRVLNWVPSFFSPMNITDALAFLCGSYGDLPLARRDAWTTQSSNLGFRALVYLRHADELLP
jgi:hypothetical protein